MVSSFHKEFLTGTHAYWISSASADNIPDAARCTSPVIENDTTLRCFVPERFSKTLRENFHGNKHISFLATHMFTFEAYQYKGTIEKIIPCSEAENELAERYCNAFGDLAPEIGLSQEQAYNMYRYPPYYAVVIKIDEIYEQALKPIPQTQ
jgi:hypothetical protein